MQITIKDIPILLEMFGKTKAINDNILLTLQKNVDLDAATIAELGDRLTKQQIETDNAIEAFSKAKSSDDPTDMANLIKLKQLLENITSSNVEILKLINK